MEFNKLLLFTRSIRFLFPLWKTGTRLLPNLVYETKYSRMDQVKLVEDSL